MPGEDTEREPLDPGILLGQIGALLGVELANDLPTALTAILAKIKDLIGENDEDAAIASAVRTQLGFEADAGRNEVLLAMKMWDVSGSAQELVRLREEASERSRTDYSLTSAKGS